MALGRVLIVDDDQDTRDIYQEVLRDGQFDVDLAKDGQEGLNKITQGGYDLILLDVMMPKIDGISVLRRLKENPPSVYNGPIFVLSALNQDQLIKQAMDFGAKGYIVKSSLTPDQIVERISNVLIPKP